MYMIIHMFYRFQIILFCCISPLGWTVLGLNSKHAEISRAVLTRIAWLYLSFFPSLIFQISLFFPPRKPQKFFTYKKEKSWSAKFCASTHIVKLFLYESRCAFLASIPEGINKLCCTLQEEYVYFSLVCGAPSFLL